MGKIKYLFLIFFGLASIFLGTQKIGAATTPVAPEPGSGAGVVINEVMANPAGDDTNKEWVEIANFGNESINLQDWQLEIYSTDATTLKKTITFNSVSLSPDGLLVVVANAGISKPCDSCLIYDGQFGSSSSNQITNASGKLSLVNPISNYQYNFVWGDDVGQGYSMEIIGPPDDPDYNTWQKSYVLGGTPGVPNSTFPDYSDEVLDFINMEDALIYTVQVARVIDGDTIEVGGLEDFPSTIRLLFVDTPEAGLPFYESANDFTRQLLGQTIDLVVSREKKEQQDRYGRTLAVIIFQDKVFNARLLEQGLASFYDTDNSVLIKDAWLEVLWQAQQERIGLWSSAGNILISELLPDPVGSDAQGEWVELYNPSDSKVDLSYFLLDGYVISSGTIIAPKSYLVFYRSQTGITLNNSGDTIKLFFPGGLPIDETSYTLANEGWTWAFINSRWVWTIKPTPNGPNILAEKVDEVLDEEAEEDIPRNSTPINIKTGEAPNYENYLVKITGTVVSTSGNTFYLDDGSGKVKIYIQAATGIDKPEMHTGDIFEITGIVNLYRGIWRILPQKQENIKLIQAKKEETDTEVAKVKTTTKSSTASTAKSSTATAKARSPTKKVAAANSQITANKNPTQVEGYKSPFWLEITKALTGLAGVFLIILLVKIWKTKRESADWRTPLGGNFGDDYT